MVRVDHGLAPFHIVFISCTRVDAAIPIENIAVLEAEGN